jgi:hypothetical protein
LFLHQVFTTDRKKAPAAGYISSAYSHIIISFGYFLVVCNFITIFAAAKDKSINK